MKKTVLFLCGLLSSLMVISCKHINMDEGKEEKDNRKYVNNEWACKPSYDILFKLDDVLCSYYTGPVSYIPAVNVTEEKSEDRGFSSSDNSINLDSEDFDEAYFDDSHTKIFDYSNIDYEKWGNYFDKNKKEHTITKPVIVFYFSDENINIKNSKESITMESYRKNVPFFDIYKHGGIDFKKIVYMKKIKDYYYYGYNEEGYSGSSTNYIHRYYNYIDQNNYNIINNTKEKSVISYVADRDFCRINIIPKLEWNDISNLSKDDNSSVHVKFRYWKDNKYNNSIEVEYDFNFSEMFNKVLTDKNYKLLYEDTF